MRLIDADELKEWITGHCDIELDEVIEVEILRVIDDQPTAFDVDKVLERLEKLQLKSMKYLGFYAVDAYQNAIEIVKGGGQSE